MIVKSKTRILTVMEVLKSIIPNSGLKKIKNATGT